MGIACSWSRCIDGFHRSSRPRNHVLVFGAQHLRQILTSYSSYYNKTRTHLSLDKDAPLRRAVERCGTIVATPILSGLHHQYARI
jgi:hypothetical protein